MAEARLDVYVSKPLFRRKQYRWRVLAANNEVLANSTEGYHNLADLHRAVAITASVLGIAITKPIPIRGR